MSLLPELGVNIDHVATLRQARKTYEPDPVTAAALAELGGADSITVHLREDRRHIQDRDVRLLRETITTKMNLELALDDAVLAIACEVKPEQATLVPERREEVSTEGGLDLLAHFDRVAAAADRLTAAGIEVSLFLDPDPKQLELAAKTAAVAVELHTGQYANATAKDQPAQLKSLQAAGEQIVAAGLRLHAGHGLTVRNVVPIARIPHMHELNIGHSIVSRSVFIGLQAAVREMKELMEKAVG